MVRKSESTSTLTRLPLVSANQLGTLLPISPSHNAATATLQECSTCPPPNGHVKGKSAVERSEFVFDLALRQFQLKLRNAWLGDLRSVQVQLAKFLEARQMLQSSIGNFSAVKQI